MLISSFVWELHNRSRSEEGVLFVVLELWNSFERHRFQVLLDLGRRCSTWVVLRSSDRSLTWRSADTDPTLTESNCLRLVINNEISYLHFQELVHLWYLFRCSMKSWFWNYGIYRRLKSLLSQHWIRLAVIDDFITNNCIVIVGLPLEEVMTLLKEINTVLCVGSAWTSGSWAYCIHTTALFRGNVSWPLLSLTCKCCRSNSVLIESTIRPSYTQCPCARSWILRY